MRNKKNRQWRINERQQRRKEKKATEKIIGRKKD